MLADLMLKDEEVVSEGCFEFFDELGLLFSKDDSEVIGILLFEEVD